LDSAYQLLISQSVLFSAIRTLPGDAVAGHSPEILCHTVLADTKTAPAALPAKRKFPLAAVTHHMGGSAFFPESSFHLPMSPCCLTALVLRKSGGIFRQM
jgi:hypothetical protein